MPRAFPAFVSMPHAVACLAASALLAGCGSSSAPPPVGTEIETPGIEGYVTDHNGYTRARVSRADSVADAAILAQFDDADPADPAGYRNLITQTEQRYVDNMQLEVIAQVVTAAGGEEIVRVLRLTADQGSFDNLDRTGAPIAKGEYFFRGAAEVFAVVDGGAVQRGVGELENMVVNFDTQTVSINLRTPLDPSAGSAIETELLAVDIPLNIVTGTFGGEVNLTTRSGDSGESLSATGLLRGNLNGDEASLSRLVENMTTSGLFTVGDAGDRFTADGIFWGSQLNYGD